MDKPSHQHGFTLVELSIVLVILGLLTGGILAGQSLIRASELRAVTSEYQRHIAAVQTFRDKYLAIPGDMNNATRFWSRQVNQAWCVTNSSASVATTGTCDGNGDGLLDAPGAASQSGEIFQFWRQLALAGLMEGEYTGNGGSAAATQAVIRTNSPASKLGNAGWSTFYNPSTFAGDAAAYRLDYGNQFRFGSEMATVPTLGPVLRPEEAWNMDTKLDDGKPASGSIIAYRWNDDCSVADDGTSANNDLIASYKLTDTSTRCALFFRKAF